MCDANGQPSDAILVENFAPDYLVFAPSPSFRRRSLLVYNATLGRAGITVRCEPARGIQAVVTWPRSWHGVQSVLEQWLKLQYYRLYVLRSASDIADLAISIGMDRA